MPGAGRQRARRKRESVALPYNLESGNTKLNLYFIVFVEEMRVIELQYLALRVIELSPLAQSFFFMEPPHSLHHSVIPPGPCAVALSL